MKERRIGQCKPLLLILVACAPFQSVYSESPTPPKSRSSQSVAASKSKSVSKVRAQSPATDESDEAIFDSKLLPAGLEAGIQIPQAPHCPDQFTPQTIPQSTPSTSQDPNLPNSATPSPMSPNAAPSVGSLGSGQGALTAQSMASVMIGDFFGGAGNSTSTILVPFHQTATGVDAISLNGSSQASYFPATIGPLQPEFIGPNQSNGTNHTLSTAVVGDVFRLNSSQPFVSGTPGNYVYPSAGHPALAITNGTATITQVNRTTFKPLDPIATLNYTELRPLVINIPSPGFGGSVGSLKIAENASPIPRDRVYFNYSYFDGVPLAPGGVNVNRFVPGFEKTFFNGMASIEVRAPFASSLSNNINADGITNNSSTQFGDLTIYLKQLLYRSETLGVSAGLGFGLPTANNVNVFAPNGQQLVSVQNQAVHLLPFFGSLYTPNEQLFIQQFLQFDFDTNGNPVSVANFNGGMQAAGRANDMTYLYYSLGGGYWIYNNPDSNRFFTRIAPIVELHYNKSLTSSDSINSNGFIIGSPGSNVDLLNTTVGMTAMMGPNKTLTAAYVTPLSGINDRQFNGEFRLLVNWYFGSPNRLTRVQL